MSLRPLLRDLEAILGPGHRGALRSYLAWVTAFGVLQGVSTEKVGGLSRMVTSGTVMVGGLFAHLLTPLVAGAVTPATIALATFFFDWRLAVAMLVTAPVMAVVFGWPAGSSARGTSCPTPLR